MKIIGLQEHQLVKQILFFNKHLVCPYIFNVNSFLTAYAVTLVAQCGICYCHPCPHRDRGRKQQSGNSKLYLPNLSC